MADDEGDGAHPLGPHRASAPYPGLPCWLGPGTVRYRYGMLDEFLIDDETLDLSVSQSVSQLDLWYV